MTTLGLFIAVGVIFLISGLYLYNIFKGKKLYRDNEMPKIRQGIV